jgi:hypothetical protein
MPTPEHVHRHWQCECHDNHFLTICYWPDESGDAEFSASIDIGGNYWTNLRMRLKMIFKLLRHGHADTNVGLILTREQALELAAELAAFATTGSAPGTGSPSARHTGDNAGPPGTGS